MLTDILSNAFITSVVLILFFIFFVQFEFKWSAVTSDVLSKLQIIGHLGLGIFSLARRTNISTMLNG